jgi:hypothetical protein
MKTFKLFMLAAAVLLLSFPAFAQGPGGPEGDQRRRGPRGPEPEMLQELLDLSDEQMEALKPIFEDTRKQVEALRDQDFESREDRREAMQAIMEGQQEKVAKVLTEEQQEKMEALHKERGKRERAGQRGRQGQQRGQRGGQKNEDLHDALKAYRAENVEPVMRTQRAKLETELSAEDKETIATLRAKRAAHQATMEERKEKRERPGPPTEAQRTERKAHHETMKGLLTKYETEIDALLAEVKPQAEEWKEDMQAIHEEYRPEDAPRGQRKGKGKKGQDREGQSEMGKKRHQMKMNGQKAHFLLMDPNNASINNALEESPFEMEAYPNPARGVANISYTVQEAGKVTIVLRNKSGNVSKVLFDGYKEAGDHTLEVNTSDLQTGTYYYTITDNSSRKPVTKQLIITQ